MWLHVSFGFLQLRICSHKINTRHHRGILDRSRSQVGKSHLSTYIYVSIVSVVSIGVANIFRSPYAYPGPLSTNFFVVNSGPLGEESVVVLVFFLDGT